MTAKAGRSITVFVHHFGDIVHPIYILWVGLAFLTAVRAAGRHSA